MRGLEPTTFNLHISLCGEIFGGKNGNERIEKREELGEGERFGGLGYRSVGYVSPLSPLPLVSRRPGNGEGGERGELFVHGVDFSLVSRGPVKELQGEEVKKMVYELASR